MKCLIAPAVLMTSPCIAHAQTPATPDTPPRATIVVTGEGLGVSPGTPAYGSVTIDRQRLLDSASDRIETVLGDVAGFQQFRRSDSRSSNPSSQGATLRALGGNASSRTLVLLDGVPVADPFFGYIPFSAIVPGRLSSVRVTRGGGAGAFGAGAVAGTIELSSATRDQLPALSMAASYGSRDATELSAALTQDLGSGYASVSGRWDRGDGFWTTPRDQRVAASVPAAYDSWSANVRAVAPAGSNAEVQFRATMFDDRRTLRFRGADSMSQGQDASIRLISRGPWQVDALAYLQARNFSNIVISTSTARRALDQRNTPSTGLGGKIELRPPTGADHVLRVGADTRFATGDMFEDAYNASLAANPVTARRRAGGDALTTGLFVEDDWTPGRLGGVVVATAGVRADRWSITNGYFRAVDPSGAVTSAERYADRSDWAFSGRAGLLVHLDPAFALRGAIYTGFRLPTLNELYRPFTVFPITTRANAALDPEKLKGAELGAEWKPAAEIDLSATVFTNRLDDAIANVTIDTNLRERQNIAAIVARGVELTATARLTPRMSLLASYAFSRSRVDAPGTVLNGLAPAQSPRHAASATVAWARPTGPSLSATLRYVGAQYEDDLQTDRLPDALTVDAVARLPLFRSISMVARAENLFDEMVVTRNSGGSIDLGTPRTLWIGIQVTG